VPCTSSLKSLVCALYAFPVSRLSTSIMARCARAAQPLLFVLFVLAIACAAAPAQLSTPGVIVTAGGGDTDGTSPGGNNPDGTGNDSPSKGGIFAAGYLSNTDGGAAQTTPSTVPMTAPPSTTLSTTFNPLGRSTIVVNLRTTVVGKDASQPTTTQSTNVVNNNQTSQGTTISLSVTLSHGGIIGFSIAGGLIVLGAATFIIWRCIRRRTTRHQHELGQCSVLFHSHHD
jgi:hypothetical protein